jgi:AAA15 family ATPase/GTPase
MLNSLKIVNFKNINQLELAHLSRINLITGKNNTSKTSLLEAIGLWASKLDFSFIYSIIDKRGELSFLKGNNIGRMMDVSTSFGSLFHNREIDYQGKKNIYIGNNKDYIEFGFVNYTVDNVEQLSLDGQKTVVGKSKRKIVDFESIEDISLGLEFITNRSKNIIIPVSETRDFNFRRIESLPDKKNFQFIRPNVQENEINGILWDKITLSEKEDYIIDALKIVEEDIEKIAFIKGESSREERLITAKVRNNAERVPLKSMGDGINRVLSISLGLVNSDNGYLLIDEFENGLHFSVQKKLWEIIFDLSVKLNVQVFATTHSEDCISAFSTVTNLEKYKNLGTLIRLEKIDKTIKIVDFHSEDLRIANENDIDLR